MHYPLRAFVVIVVAIVAVVLAICLVADIRQGKPKGPHAVIKPIPGEPYNDSLHAAWKAMDKCKDQQFRGSVTVTWKNGNTPTHTETHDCDVWAPQQIVPGTVR